MKASTNRSFGHTSQSKWNLNLFLKPKTQAIQGSFEFSPSLAFFGFCIIYMLRVNLSVAIVAMTANKTHILENGTTITVS